MTTITNQPPVTSPAPPPGATTKPNGVLDKDSFLKLLVAQLKYQDPMAPSDPAAMMQQSSQMAMVERLEELQKSTAQLLTSEKASGAAALIGRQVTWTDPTTKAERTGVVGSVRLGTAGPQLVIGDTEVAYDSVTSVAAPAPAPAPAPAA